MEHEEIEVVPVVEDFVLDYLVQFVVKVIVKLLHPGTLYQQLEPLIAISF
jgi:hypothetical protein